MGLFDDLFKKQPGGSTAGNILRDVASQLTNGAFGKGTLKQTQKDADKVSLSDAEYQLKYHETKGGATVAPPSISDVITKVAGGVQQATTWAVIKRYWYIVLIPFLLLAALAYFIQKSRKGRK